MLRFIYSLFCIILISAFLPACTTPHMIIPVDPEGFSPRYIGRITPGGTFSPDPAALRIAVEHKGLVLLSINDGTEKILSKQAPLALAWSNDGQRLAAAFAEEGQSKLVIYNADSREEMSLSIQGRVTQLEWSPSGELFALAVNLKVYTFGTNQKGTLLRWSPHDSIKREPLFDTTLKPRTLAELGDSFYRLSRFDLSPLGDEIIYTRLADPPVIGRSIKMTHRHLSSGAEGWVYDIPLESGGSFWSFDSEKLLISDGSRTYQFDPWQRKELQKWQLPGQHLALSPVENMIYVDGFLYRNGQELAQLQSGRASFSHDGKHLVVADQKSLLMYSLPSVNVVDPAPQPIKERLLLLRELRSKGLVTMEEYLHTRESLLP